MFALDYFNFYKAMTQSKQVLNYIKPFGRSITPMTAFSKFGITCLSERIRDIRNQGHPVKTEMVTRNKKRFAKYYL